MFHSSIFVPLLLIVPIINAASFVHLQKRIVHGKPAPGKLPWLVSIRTESGDHFCGGSLIHERVVLTGKSYPQMNHPAVPTNQRVLIRI
jgi:hypothetical protein